MINSEELTGTVLQARCHINQCNFSQVQPYLNCERAVTKCLPLGRRVPLQVIRVPQLRRELPTFYGTR